MKKQKSPGGVGAPHGTDKVADSNASTYHQTSQPDNNDLVTLRFGASSDEFIKLVAEHFLSRQSGRPRTVPESELLMDDDWEQEGDGGAS